MEKVEFLDESRSDEDIEAILRSSEKDRGRSQNRKDRGQHREIAPPLLKQKKEADANESQNHGLLERPREIEEDAGIGEGETRLPHNHPKCNHDQCDGGHVWPNAKSPLTNDRGAEPQAKREKER